MTQRKWGTGPMYIAPSPTTAEVYALGCGRTAPSRDLIAAQCLNNRMYTALWKQVASARTG